MVYPVCGRTLCAPTVTFVPMVNVGEASGLPRKSES